MILDFSIIVGDLMIFNKKTSTSVVLSIVLGCSSFSLYADDPIGEETKFNDRELLAQTLLGEFESTSDAENSVTEAKTQVEDAKGALETAEKSGIEEDIISAKSELKNAEESLVKAELSLSVAVQAEKIFNEELLTEEEVIALNRSLNNAINNGLIDTVDTQSILDAVVDGDLNKQQVNALTKAYEEEAKFQKLANKFELKAEESGNDKFLNQAERMENKASFQKNKFLSKVDRFSAIDGDSAVAVKGFSKKVGKDRINDKSLIKGTAKRVAKGAAKEAAKSAAKGQAKQNAKNVAKQNAKDVSKQIVKEQGKSSNKGKGKKDK